MGVSLVPIGNHKIKIKHRTHKAIAAEIMKKLDSYIPVNNELLKKALAIFFREEVKTSEKKSRTNDTWMLIPEKEFYPSKGIRRIEFKHPLGLKLTFETHRIVFWQPPYRYNNWLDDECLSVRDEWRKYFKQIVTLFGGDRVIYLADSWHPLCKYDYAFHDGFTFEEIEEKIKKEMGTPKKSFEEVAENFQGSYFTDTFEDLD